MLWTRAGSLRRRRIATRGAGYASDSTGQRTRRVLLALAATAWHALSAPGAAPPDLIVGHGVLGRLLARLAKLKGAAPTVWESRPERQGGGDDLPYAVIDPSADPRHDYQAIYDVSGDASLLDSLIARLTKNGEVTLAGFYERPLAFAFPPAFMREARIRVAAEWRPNDLEAVKSLIESGALSLDGLITHRCEAARAAAAYRTAFEDPNCLKMVLDWRACA
jgi:bacteriochlorophyllide a dehydrogenase